MEQQIRDILEKYFKAKYKASKKAIESATIELVKLMTERPPVQKHGVVVMTEEASMAADKKLQDGRQKPQII